MAMKIKHFADKVPMFVKYLRTFGEAGVVTIAGTVKVKVDMRGILCCYYLDFSLIPWTHTYDTYEV
jgi:hypothetical protein